jgi:predicted component of type VI protein secretion system
MLDYGIGGVERKANNANEGISDIPLNRTFLIEKLTGEAPVSPEIVYDLKNIGEVFGHFQPQLDVEFQTEEGAPVQETLRFASLSDFSTSNIIKQSELLTSLHTHSEIYLKLVQQLKSNKMLLNLLNNKEAKEAYLTALDALIAEIDEAENQPE